MATKETELGRSNATFENFKRFFDLSLDMLCIAGLDGYFKMVNPAWQATLGFTSEEMVSRPFTDFIHPDDVEATNETYATQVAQGKDVVEFENRYLCKDGSYKWLVWNAKTVTKEELIYAVAHDITERKRTEDVWQFLAAIVDSS
ncbi:MAG: PAS domain S-box protein [Dehalococcoidia bacterium]